MKKLFLKRHYLFFITAAILATSLAWIVKDCIGLCGAKINQKGTVDALAQTLGVRRERLPEDHLAAERQIETDLAQYRKFAAETWKKMLKLAYANEARTLPSNHVAVFFEISDYLTWAKESCDSFGIEFDSSCSFGFRDSFAKDEQPLSSEIYDIHRQKEQLKLLLSYLFESKMSYMKIISVERGDTSASAYFDGDDVFVPEIRQVEDAKSYVYRIKFTTFTNSFRAFMRNLYENEIPVIFRQISVQPNHTVKLTKGSGDRILESLASTFTLVLEFLDTPQNLTQYSRQNAAIYRRIMYWTAP
jgi:hypothetical protein